MVVGRVDAIPAAEALKVAKRYDVRGECAAKVCFVEGTGGIEEETEDLMPPRRTGGSMVLIDEARRY